MKRLSLWIVSTAAGVVLLFSYHTSTSGAAGGRVVTGLAPVGVVADSPVTAASPSPSSTAAPTTTSPTTTARKTPTSRRINGAAVPTRYGPVQVQITLSDSRVVLAKAIAYPTGNRRDAEINSRAIPRLDSEVVQAQSASIDAVSGASFTSEGYRESLQSALDAAHQ